MINYTHLYSALITITRLVYDTILVIIFDPWQIEYRCKIDVLCYELGNLIHWAN